MPGFKNSYIVEKQLYNGMLMEKEKELLLPADTDQRHLVALSGHPLNIESDFTAADFAAQSAVRQYSPLHNEPAALAHQQDFAPS